jgi:uncharacterized Zn finger protein (UPF0148 family)
MSYEEPECIGKCLRETEDGVTTCSSCGKTFVSMTEKYKDQESLVSEEDKKILEIKNETEEIRMMYYVNDNKEVIDRGLKSGILDKNKIEHYRNEYKKKKL